MTGNGRNCNKGNNLNTEPLTVSSRAEPADHNLKHIFTFIEVHFYVVVRSTVKPLQLSPYALRLIYHRRQHFVWLTV